MTGHFQASRAGTLGRQAGVSLIEALLALVVMSLGMLAVVGVQATLRASGDLSRQRAEAVRLAQEAVETWRNFASVTAVAGQQDYTDIASDGPTDVTPAGANATYTRTRVVAPAPANGSPPAQTFSVTVQWVDRAGEDQRVQLFSTVARVSPALAVSMSVPPNGGPARQPLGRHVAIPRGAVTGPSGTSTFTPPQPTGPNTTTLEFNNLTGEIVCISVNGGPCSPDRAHLLTGLVGVPASNPTFAMRVDYKSSAGAATVTTTPSNPARSALWDHTQECFLAAPQTNVVEYFCVLRLAPDSNGFTPAWSGQVVFTPGTDFVSATNAAAPLRACRYNPIPDPYNLVNQPLSNQNFLLVPSASTCPGGTQAHLGP